MKNRALARFKPYTVQSLADGTLLVTPAWGPRGVGGVLDRITLAALLEVYLNTPPKRRRRRGGSSGDFAR